MKVVWSAAALSDFAQILAHMPPDVAANTVRRVSAVEKNIESFPQAALFDTGTGTFERYVPRTRLILIYQISDDAIEMIAVFHTSRNPANKPDRT